jgi:hypothetical protein
MIVGCFGGVRNTSHGQGHFGHFVGRVPETIGKSNFHKKYHLKKCEFFSIYFILLKRSPSPPNWQTNYKENSFGACKQGCSESNK